MLGFRLLDYVKMAGGALAGAALAAMVVGPIEHHKGYKAGTAAMVAAVEKQNAEAAIHARASRLKVDACYDKGGDWDQERGRCTK